MVLFQILKKVYVVIISFAQCSLLSISEILQSVDEFSAYRLSNFNYFISHYLFKCLTHYKETKNIENYLQDSNPEIYHIDFSGSDKSEGKLH